MSYVKSNISRRVRLLRWNHDLHTKHRYEISNRQKHIRSKSTKTQKITNHNEYTQTKHKAQAKIHKYKARAHNVSSKQRRREDPWVRVGTWVRYSKRWLQRHACRDAQKAMPCWTPIICSSREDLILVE